VTPSDYADTSVFCLAADRRNPHGLPVGGKALIGTAAATSTKRSLRPVLWGVLSQWVHGGMVMAPADVRGARLLWASPLASQPSSSTAQGAEAWT
jgi:hypothetical protein